MSVPIPLIGVHKINDRAWRSAFGRGGYIFAETKDTPGSRERIIRVRTRKKQLQALILGGEWTDVTKVWQE